VTGAARRRLAPAKVNLFLHVTGRRPDGYHLLDSLVGFVGIGDTVAVAPAVGLHLAVEGRFAAAAGGAADNLVLKAARALAELCRVSADAALRLEKRLPVAAGLGGGSSDAAATLRLLCDFWQVAPDPAALRQLALGLGADVPVCLAGRPALMAGIGELLTPTALPAAHLLLANPGIALPTPKVFGALAGRFSPAEPWLPPPDFASLARALAHRRNDLERPAIELEPAIAGVLEQLGRLPGARLARMSGSGATCFALFERADAAAAAAVALAADRPGWWVGHGPLLREAWA